MTCRGGKTFDGRWGAPTMIALGGGSAGLQIGGNATDFVLLLMSPRSATSILKSKVKLGGDATAAAGPVGRTRSEEHTSELQSLRHLVCRLLLEKKKYKRKTQACLTPSPRYSSPLDSPFGWSNSTTYDVSGPADTSRPPLLTTSVSAPSSRTAVQ